MYQSISKKATVFFVAIATFCIKIFICGFCRKILKTVSDLQKSTIFDKIYSFPYSKRLFLLWYIVVFGNLNFRRMSFWQNFHFLRNIKKVIKKYTFRWFSTHVYQYLEVPDLHAVVWIIIFLYNYTDYTIFYTFVHNTSFFEFFLG